MKSIGQKIRTLRKNKHLTQEQLAEALSVSSQSVSKWENQISTPDVALLPIIARYFGITMDELFNYRLDALSYKERFIRFMADNGVLRFGEFRLQSGRVTPYFLNTGEYRSGSQITKLGEFYAKAYFDKLGEKKAVLYGPAYKGISLSVSAAVALSKNGLNVPFFFNRKEVKDHGEGGTFVGYVPQAGEEIVIIEDVITAGTAIRESMEILSHLEGVKVAATFIMVDRKEKGQGDKGAMQEIEEQFGFPVYSIVDVYDIIEYLEEDEKNEENVQRIKNYLAINGAKA